MRFASSARDQFRFAIDYSILVPRHESNESLKVALKANMGFSETPRRDHFFIGPMRRALIAGFRPVYWDCISSRSLGFLHSTLQLSGKWLS
jgi:hypothetical protein